MLRFDPGTATCEVFTFREGVLAAAGHDLKLRATRFELEVTRESVSARFEADSLRVVAAMRGRSEDPGALSARDRTFVAKNAKGQVVNRTPGMAMIGGCTDTNEFNFLQWKFISALGIPYRDSQARV